MFIVGAFIEETKGPPVEDSKEESVLVFTMMVYNDM